MTSTFAIAIFARGGSKGLPNKNLLSIAGKSLMQRAYESAFALPFAKEIYCSTDSELIADVARRSGGVVPWLRPAVISTDTSREWDAWVHFVQWQRGCGIYADYLMTVPLTAPLRTTEDLLRCARVAQETKADVVFGIYESSKNPWFTMVTRDDSNGKVQLVNKPPTRINNRQEAPMVYDVAPNTFIIRCEFLLNAQSIYDGDTRGVELPRENCIDIDTDLDFRIAECLLSQRERG